MYSGVKREGKRIRFAIKGILVGKALISGPMREITRHSALLPIDEVKNAPIQGKTSRASQHSPQKSSRVLK
jgi:hypothetical protein